MVTKSRKPNPGKKKKIKVLSLKKETVKDLTGTDAKRVRGGLGTVYCSYSIVSKPSPTGVSINSISGSVSGSVSRVSGSVSGSPSA